MSDPSPDLTAAEAEMAKAETDLNAAEQAAPKPPAAPAPPSQSGQVRVRLVAVAGSSFTPPPPLPPVTPAGVLIPTDQLEALTEAATVCGVKLVVEGD